VDALTQFRAAVTGSIARWRAIGARLEEAYTMLLLPEHAAEGRATRRCLDAAAGVEAAASTGAKVVALSVDA
jgi:hypothetical protein